MEVGSMFLKSIFCKIYDSLILIRWKNGWRKTRAEVAAEKEYIESLRKLVKGIRNQFRIGEDEFLDEMIVEFNRIYLDCQLKEALLHDQYIIELKKMYELITDYLNAKQTFYDMKKSRYLNPDRNKIRVL